MNILQVGFTDSAGKRFNGSVLQQELNKNGISSSHCVWKKNQIVPIPGNSVISMVEISLGI
jgi:hypothetical protein